MHMGASLCHRTTLVRQAQQVTLHEKNTGPVLPALCVIFKTTDKIITVGGKRQKDPPTHS